MYWGTEKSRDPLKCDICSIAVVWNRTRRISEVCLCSHHGQFQATNMSSLNLHSTSVVLILPHPGMGT